MLSSIISTLALALAASAVPVANPKGTAWADVTQCSYTLSLGYPTGDPRNALRWDPPINYIGTIMQYTTYDGWSATIYSSLTQVNTTNNWADEWQTYCTMVNGYNYCFQGTWQATKTNSDPQLWVWGPNTMNQPVHLPASQPSAKVEAKGNNFQSLCLQKWPISTVQAKRSAPPGGAIGSQYCTTKWDGTLLPNCPDFRSQTWSYYNVPYTL